ncbi:MAG: cell surface protein SprA [Balneolaceae bacterium]
MNYAYAQETGGGTVRETALPDTTGRSQDFDAAFRIPYTGRIVAKPFLRPLPRLYYISLPGETVSVERREDGRYMTRQFIGNVQTGLPGIYSFEEYAETTKEEQVYSNWLRLIEESERSDSRQRGLLDFRFTVPGGRESAFTTIFGQPEVNLRVNGVANMNVGASIQHTADPSLPEDQQTRVDPTFEQNLQLNIQGTIGDKLTIQTDWDTERMFDYQNRLHLMYEGYEDEIIKQVEMGNVTMQTGNSLIRGSGSLFGVKTVAEMGALRLTSILSQQKGESNVETITGGSQEQEIQIRPADYENHRHFFLDFYTRQEFEESLSNPQQARQTLQISELNVWVLHENIQAEEGSRLAIALAGYGVVETGGDSYAPPDNQRDRFSQNQIDPFRDPSVSVSASELGLDNSRDFEEGYFTLLQEGQDYTVNNVSGYISLNRSLGPREVLAVSFSYRGANGETISVGDVTQGGNERIFLKMLRPNNMSTDHKTFPLTMRNVYSLGVSDLTRENIDLEVQFTEGNVAHNFLPGRNSLLLQDLGLDRVDSQGSPEPDNQIDFGTGTLNALNGRIVFPYLEPFGNRMEELLNETGASQEDIDRLVYNELYTERQQNSARSSKNTFYRIGGTVKGGVQNNFSLGIALVEGSVNVFANGTELQEGVDYQVDYSFGSVTILNERYTAPGQEIRIEYENQEFTSIAQKSFVGVRAEYQVNNDINFGGTFFRYNERPLDDKIRIGDEPITNTVFGFDTNASFDAPVLTRVLDAFPLLSTRESSEITLSGEFAQLRPGVVQTRAVDRAIRNDELQPDEKEGLSFIDDFEGSSIKINLLNATRWQLAAPPSAVPGYEPDLIYFEEELSSPASSPLHVQVERSDLSSKLAWYTIPRNISSILDDVQFTPESELVRVNDVFPGRETRNPQEEIITTMDVYFDPTRRGPYNYNRDLRNLLEEEPERTWGGMTTVLPSGQEDFTQNNVEFLEFWVQPLLPGGRNPTAGDLEDYDGKIYIDIGIVSEDVVPNARLNTEDGLALNPESLIPDRIESPRSFIPANPPPPEGEFSTANRDLEDVGLDGIPAEGGVNGLNERSIFSGFVEAMRDQYGQSTTAFQEIFRDPSNDQYIYYGESQMENRPLHERFHRMLGYYEGNTPLDQSDRRAVTNRPNTEGLLNPSRVELNNAYFQYEVDLNPADFGSLNIGSGGSFIVDKVPGSRQEDRWYLVRIPVEEYKRKVGDIEDFQNITYVRFWMSGYEKPFTMRFATLEFVGSQWQKAEQINQVSDPAADVKVSTINIEENANRQPIPYRQPLGAIRAQDRGTQLQVLANEQSIVLDLENLGPQSIQMVKRNYPGGLNLLNYSNMRMFVHGEGYQNRGEAELVMRFGNDLENNYYEYRQPITPTDSDYPFQGYDQSETGRMEEEAEQIWIYEENSMNIVLNAFNQLKQLRDQEAPEDYSEVYERGGLLEDAVPGAVIAIKGNPSLDRVSEIGMGIRNPFDPDNPSGNGKPVLNGRFCMNELRVSGFDNKRGWAANARASFKLADFATMNANLTRQTDGFGALDSRLGQRRVSDQTAYDISSTMNLHRFIPERFGWNIPVTFTTRSSLLTPRYLPNQGDVRVSDFEEAVRSRTDIGEDIKDRIIDGRIQDVQTYNESWSVNLSNVTKQNSENLLTRYTLDNTTFNYVYNQSKARNPQNLFQDNWNFNSSLRYNINFQNRRFLQPFGFLEEVPLLNQLSGFQLGYMPNNFTTSVSTSRTYEERRRRVFQAEAQTQGQPLQQTHNFNYNTTIGFGYNLTRSITTNFQARGTFDLNRAATRDANLSGIDSTAYQPVPTFTVLQDLVSGDEVKPRRSSYQEDYTASWQPRFNQLRVISWMNYSLRYGGGFRWENTPLGSNLGARISNTYRLDHNLRLEVADLLGRIDLLGELEQADNDEQADRQNRRQGEEEDSGESLTFGDHLVHYGRKMLLALFSIQNIDISYNDSKTGSQAGYAGNSQLYDMFAGDSFTPPFSYRLGITERIGTQQLINNEGGAATIQLPANNTYSDQLTVGSRFNPFNDFSIELDWSAQWDERVSESFALDPNNELTSVVNASGNVGSSVWAFGRGYRDLFDRQLQTAFDDISSSADSIRDSGGNRDGRTVLNRITLQEDFRGAYLGSGSSVIGSRNFTPFPMPGWRVNWTGLENWLPWIGSFIQRASITHAYSGQYRLGWIFNSNPGPLQPIRIGSYVVEDERPEYEPSNINIEKRFSPLIQLNITWDNNLRTQTGYEYSKLTSLALSNTNVTERTSKGLRLSVTYTFRNFRLPFLRQTNNNLDITINGNYIEDSEQRFLLDSDIDRALSDGHEVIVRDPSAYSISPRPPSGQTRIHTSAILGYRFSNMLQANFEYAFSRILPKSSRTFERTTHDFRFNIRINIRS